MAETPTETADKTLAIAPYETLRVDREVRHVAEIVLNRPEQLNTFTPLFFEEIERAVGQAERDSDVRVIIIRAEGRMFTAGLDLKASLSLMGAGAKSTPDSQARTNRELLDRIKRLQRSISVIEECPKPVICAVQGHCIGGGVDLATACDIRLCTEDATFAIHETKIAIVADLGTLQRITRVVGRGIAREMAFTGARMPAERALRTGLVNEVYPGPEALQTAARAMAAEIAANSPLAVQGSKSVLNYSEQHTIEEGLDFVAQWNSSFLQSNDLKEAVRAFFEKRNPSFNGD